MDPSNPARTTTTRSTPASPPMSDHPAGTPQRWTAMVLWTLLGIALVACGWLETIIARDVFVLPSLILFAGAVLLLAGRRALTGPSRRGSIALGMAIVGSLALWFVTRWFPFWLAGQIFAIIGGVHCCRMAWRSHAAWEHPGDSRFEPSIATRLAGWSVLGLVGLVSLALVTISITADPLVTLLVPSRNSFAAPAESRTAGPYGTVRIADVRYGSRFPNSYLDIYLGKGGAGSRRPTMIYLHGGGYVLGDKATGDPNAGGSGYAGGQADALQAGYNVIQVNYALAPAYKYPTPLIQLSQAVAFLQRHAADYGLDMGHVVVGGGSAGGHLAAQFALVQTDARYAAKVGIPAVLDRAALTAVVLESPALDPARASQTQSPDLANDFQFGGALRSYFGLSDGHNPATTVTQQANIIMHVSSRYPPTFVGDGNHGTFPDQARDFSRRLDGLGVANTLVLYSPAVATLGHGFMASPSRWTDDYTKRKDAFLISQLIDRRSVKRPISSSTR